MNIGQLVNQNSYAIAAAILVAWGARRALLGHPTVRSVGLFALFAVALTLPVVWLRSAQHELRELDVALGSSGRPTLLEVYSDL